MIKKCFKINLKINKIEKKFFFDELKKTASELRIEGLVKINNDSLIINICGTEENTEKIIDFLYINSKKYSLKDIDTKHSTDEKIFNGIFRIIE